MPDFRAHENERSQQPQTQHVSPEQRPQANGPEHDMGGRTVVVTGYSPTWPGPQQTVGMSDTGEYAESETEYE